MSRLRLLNRRLTGKDVQGLNVAEYKKLKTHLEESILIVEEEISKWEVIVEEDISKREEALRCCYPNLYKNKREGGDDEATMTSSRRDDQVPPPQSRLQIEYERQRAESPQSDFQRLWLWKERMSCRGPGDMTYAELGLLQIQMRLGLSRMMCFSLL